MVAVSVKVDATRALAKFNPSTGIPWHVRSNLRAMLPDLTKRLGRLVEQKLDAGLKSRRRLEVKKELVENPTSIYGRITTISTAEPFLLPQWLESGTKAHVIEAKNADALYFFWEKLGANVFYRRVMHPGFAGIHYTQDAFSEMEGEILASLEHAVREGARAA